MKKTTNYNLSGIAPSFVWTNLTCYQQESIKLRYKVITLVDSRSKGVSKDEMFTQVGEQVSLTYDRVKQIYYSTKK